MGSSMPPVHIGDDVIIDLRDKCWPIIQENESNPEFQGLAMSQLNTVLGQSLQRYYDWTPEKRIPQAQYETGEILKSWYPSITNPYPPPSFEPVHPDPLVGIVRVNDKVFYDANGPCYPIGLHLGDGFLNYCEGNPDSVFILDEAAEIGYHFTRFWAPLMYHQQGNNLWPPGRGCSPAVTPNYWDKLEAYCIEHINRKLKIHLSIGDLNNISQGEINVVFDGIANIMAKLGAEHFILPGEVNESEYVWVGASPSQMSNALQRIQSRFPDNIYGLTSYTGNPSLEKLKEYTAPFQRSYYKHGYRDAHYWDKIRHMFSDGYEYYKQIRPCGSDHEGAGTGPLVSATQHPEEMDANTMGALGLMAALARQSWCYFCSPGVRMGEDFNTMPGFSIVPRLVRMLPKGLGNGVLHHSGTSWIGTRVFSAVGEFRVDGVVNGQDFAYVGYGPGTSVQIPVNRSFDGYLVRLDTAEVSSISGSAGDYLPTIGYNKAILIYGKVR